MKDHSINISKKFCPSTCNETAIKADLHFSHYKPMETKLPQQSKFYAMAKTPNSFPEAHAVNIPEI